jgi:hypothetical protein
MVVGPKERQADRSMALTIDIAAIAGELGYSNEDLAAARAYVARRDRTAHPAGHFDKARRFCLNGSERGACCAAIREPSRAFPYSEMTHARSAEHVASLHGVEALSVKRLAKLIDHVAGYEPATAHDGLSASRRIREGKIIRPKGK